MIKLQKFSAVENIVRETYKQEIKRRMSHGEILKLSENEPSNASEKNVEKNETKASFTSKDFVVSPNASTSSVNEYKNVMNTKVNYFKANVMVRSQSSSSNTSR